MSSTSATVETLTAEVRVLMVGNRQVTLSVYRQLDEVDSTDIEPFGRVRDSQQAQGARRVHVVGVHRETGALVRSCAEGPKWPVVVSNQKFLNAHVERVYSHSRPDDDLALERIERSGPEQFKLYTATYSDGVERLIVFEYSHGKTQFRWTSADAREAAQPVFARWIAEAEAAELLAAGWSSLPLIVLAGLR